MGERSNKTGWFTMDYINFESGYELYTSSLHIYEPLKYVQIIVDWITICKVSGKIHYLNLKVKMMDVI